MGYVYSYSGSANTYTWTSLNTYNQHVALVTVPANCAITDIAVYAGGKDAAVNTRLCLWSNSGSRSLLRQSATFSMAKSSVSVGGQSWKSASITPYAFSASTTIMAGLYRNPSGSHVFGCHSSGTGYRKTNTSSFPSVKDMSSYSSHSGKLPLVRLTYILKPTAPGQPTVTRVSDTKHTVTWARNPTTEKPYTSQKLERWNNASASWSEIASLSGTTTSYSDTGTTTNRQYKYRVRAYNAAGYSSYSTESSTIKTSPSAPSNVTAIRSGSSVLLAWTNNSSALGTYIYAQVAESPYSAYVKLDKSGGETQLAGNAVLTTDTTPYALGKYRVRSYISDSGNTLYSAYAYSNTIQTLQAPAAPTNLNPTSLNTLDVALAQLFTWQHNSLDTSQQSKFSLEYRVQGAAWDTPQLDEESSSDSFYQFPADTFTSGTIYEWRVKTWGSYATGSDWSATASFKASASPSVAITAPENEGTIASSRLTVTWDYGQVDDEAQAQYDIKLYDENDVLLETQAGYGSGTTVTFNYLLSDATNYYLTLQASNVNGLWSELVQADFSTGFLTPTKPVLTLSPTEDLSGVIIDIENPAVVSSYNNIAEQETYTDSANPTVNYNGTYPLSLYGSGGELSNLLLDFPSISDIVGKTIVSATLVLYRYTALTDVISSLVKYCTTAFVGSTVTHATLPTLDGTEHDSHSHVDGETEEWDLTDLITDIADGTITDFNGICVIPTAADGEDLFYGSDNAEFYPRLLVTIEPENADTESNTLYRAVEDGDYEIVLTEIAPNTTLIDRVPGLLATNNYYVQAISPDDTINTSDVESIENTLDGVFVFNSGENYNNIMILFGDTELSFAKDFSRTFIQFDGRENPVLFEDGTENHTLKFSCNLPFEFYSDFDLLLKETGGGFYRDYQGNWFKCGFTDINFVKQDDVSYKFSCTITKVVE